MEVTEVIASEKQPLGEAEGCRFYSNG